MKQIFLTEQHIRKLVKETLENLILGEDNYIIPLNKNMTINDCINLIDKDCKFDGVNEIDIDHIDLLFNTNDNEFIISVLIDFDLDGEYEPYDSGDYYTPPTGGGYNLKDIIPYSVTFECEEEKLNFKLIKNTREYKYISLLLNSWFDNIAEKCYDEIEPEEPDEDMYRDR